MCTKQTEGLKHMIHLLDPSCTLEAPKEIKVKKIEREMGISVVWLSLELE